MHITLTLLFHTHYRYTKHPDRMRIEKEKIENCVDVPTNCIISISSVWYFVRRVSPITIQYSNTLLFLIRSKLDYIYEHLVRVHTWHTLIQKVCFYLPLSSEKSSECHTRLFFPHLVRCWCWMKPTKLFVSDAVHWKIKKNHLPCFLRLLELFNSKLNRTWFSFFSSLQNIFFRSHRKDCAILSIDFYWIWLPVSGYFLALYDHEFGTNRKEN